MGKTTFRGIAAGLSLTVATNAGAAPQLASHFTDNMVLQRDRLVPVWGTAEPGEAVTVSLAGTSKAVTADEAGHWEVTFPAMAAGGGRYSLKAESPAGADTADNILAGDVWLCSGQSNMAWPVSRAQSGAGAMAGPFDPEIRLLSVELQSNPAPQAALPGTAQWRLTDAESVGAFSAVCYMMARELRKTEDVPLGLINASWGGSQIEAWIGKEALATVAGFETPLDLLGTYQTDPAAAMAAFGRMWESWWASAADQGDVPWTDNADAAGWKAAPDGLGDWKQYGDPDIANHLGMLWYRRIVDLGDVSSSAGGTLSIAGIDEVDSVWVNGQFIANSFGWGTPRTYDIPAGVLTTGQNVITVNVYNSWGQGGMIGPVEDMSVQIADGRTVPLAGGWQYKKAPGRYGTPPRAPWESIGGLTGLSNAMIAPFGEMPVKGALWYQGESNTGRGKAYAGLMAALVQDWRSRFGEDLPVIIIQLPGYGGLPTDPGESGWSDVRNGMRAVAQADPHVGLVVTVDTGDQWDIHPPNKNIVAARAATVARRLAYGETGETDGFGPSDAKRRGRTVTVQFPSGYGLDAIGAEHPTGFQLCDAVGECAFADASLEGDVITVRSDEIRTPALVRYGWGDTPFFNLYSAEGVPVTPFELSVD